MHNGDKPRLGRARFVNMPEEIDRLWKLETQVNELIRTGKRSAKSFANILQAFMTGSSHSSFGSSGEENGEVITPTAPTPVGWTVDDEGNIYFTVTSNGFSPQQWERRLESRDFRLSDWARNVLRRVSEAPTNGVAYHIVVRPGSKIASPDRVTKKIRAHATDKGWKTPHWEVACLIRDTFTDEQLEVMGLWYIVTMHEPIKDSDGHPSLLNSLRRVGGRGFYADYGSPDDFWNDSGGFAFVVSCELFLKLS